MTQQDIYTVAQAAQALNLSKAALRAYASKELYKRYLSTEATPEPGYERKFTADDLRLFAFIAARTKLGESHEDVAQLLGANALLEFDWTPPELQQPAEPSEAQTGQLVPLEQVRALQALLADARQRESETRDQAQTQIQLLQDEVRALTRELGTAQGELAAVRRRRPQWWIRMFGE